LIVMAGGYSGTSARSDGGSPILNDVWASADGGYTWGNCVVDAEWDDRRYQMTVLDGAGFMWVMGGAASNGALYDDVWKSVWSFEDLTTTAQRCKLTIPACGVGLKCWPTAPGTMLATDKTGVYCTACQYQYGGSSSSSSSSASSSNTTIIAFLVVFIIGFVAAISALGYTYWKLRSAGTPSPIPLPASAQKWWNKSTSGLNGGAIGDTQPLATNNTANGDGLYQPLRIRDQV